MDAMVTARVPVEVRNQGNAILKRIGSSPTKLVNAAYDYVLRHESLPDQEPSAPAAGGEPQKTVRIITPEIRAQIEAAFAAVALPTPVGGWDPRDYKEIIAEGKRADYEALG